MINDSFCHTFLSFFSAFWACIHLWSVQGYLTVLILLIVIYLLATACLCCTGLFHLLFQLTQDPGQFFFVHSCRCENFLFVRCCDLHALVWFMFSFSCAFHFVGTIVCFVCTIGVTPLISCPVISEFCSLKLFCRWLHCHHYSFFCRLAWADGLPVWLLVWAIHSSCFWWQIPWIQVHKVVGSSVVACRLQS